MEHKAFAKYCKVNKVKELIPDEFRIEMIFENGETIFISTSYDGLVYTHKDELNGTDTKALFKALQELAPGFTENLKKKYQSK